MVAETAKSLGAFYTPVEVASTLVRWLAPKNGEHLLDPSCGDGRFLSHHQNATGVDCNDEALTQAATSSPHAVLIHADFFAWAGQQSQQFDLVAGNPPFIRYQRFNGENRKKALSLCQKLGARFSGLTSSWAPFIVAAASLLKPGGRLGFVVPAEIGHAPYAQPLLRFLKEHFSSIQLVAIRDKLFTELSEDCWLLTAHGFGGRTNTIGMTVMPSFTPGGALPRLTREVSDGDWRAWNGRLRPFLLGDSARDFYRYVYDDPRSVRLGDIAQIGIGYVSGDNNFFHLRPSEASNWRISSRFLVPSVRTSRWLHGAAIDRASVASWRKNDEPYLLLSIPPETRPSPAIEKYLNTPEGEIARNRYKCRVRAPWYSVPGVLTPDAFLTYMSGTGPRLVENQASCVCSNTLHAVTFTDPSSRVLALRSWESDLCRLSTELEGHPLGGGMLKLEPTEASRIMIATDARETTSESQLLREAITTIQEWRHYVK